MQGISDGQSELQSVMPSAYQPKGKAYPQNPFQGTLDAIKDQLLEVASLIGKQGDEFREQEQSLIKAAFDVTKVNNQLLKAAQGDSASESQ